MKTLLSVLAQFLALVVIPGAGWANTWHVTCDPGQPEDRVGAAVAQAATGDTILVDAGTYYEHIDVGSKSLTFLGAGQSQTVLDGGRDLPDREGSILYSLRVASPVHISGFTLRNGHGAVGEAGLVYGGAVCWWSTTGSTVSIVDCAFEDNEVQGDLPYFPANGGAVFVSGTTETSITSCRFSNNYASGAGGGCM